MKLKIALCAVATAAVILLGGCKPGTQPKSVTQSPDSALTHIRMGIAPYQDTLLPIIGSDKYKGWFRKAGLDMEFKVLALDEAREGLAAGQLDLTINEISAIVAAHHNSPNLRYVYGFNTFDSGFAIVARPQSGFKSVSELEAALGNRKRAIEACAQQFRGKTVITMGNSDFELAVAAAVSRGGVKYSKGADSEVKLIDLPPDDGLAAFLSGQGDFYLGGIPQRTRAGKEGMKEIISGLDMGAAPINGLCTTEGFYAAHKSDIMKVLDVWFQIVNYAEQNQDEAGAIIAKELNANTGAEFTVADFKRFWQQLEHYPLSAEAVQKDILTPGAPNYWKVRWDACNEFYVKTVKSIPAPVSPDGVFLMEGFQKEYQSRHSK